MAGRIRLVFRHEGPSATPGEFAALLDDIEAAYRVAFWTNRLGGLATIVEEQIPEDTSRLPFRQDFVGAQPAAWVPLPPPPTRTDLELHAESLSYASPFEFLGSVQGIVGAGGVGGILWFFARNLEDLFDMPDRIRLRRIRRERQMYEEALARDQSRRAYLDARRPPARRFELIEGELADDEDADE